MNLKFDTSLSEGYKSQSQIARVLTENWVLNNSYCPSCGSLPLIEYEKNRPVADFYCDNCSEQFELKSKCGKFSNIIMDGSYFTMIDRINSENNPNFFFLSYTRQWTINDFFIIPKQFFLPDIIIKRSPLSQTAKRAGWTGCNIDISKVSDIGKVFLIRNAQVLNPQAVKEKYNKTLFLRSQTQDAKGWILDIINCIDLIKKETFTLEEVYNFEQKLAIKYPNNNFIREKIRQQLQLLRDKGIIEFVSRGSYKKIVI